MRSITYSGDFLKVQELTKPLSARLVQQVSIDCGGRLAKAYEVEDQKGRLICIWGTGMLHHALEPLLPRARDTRVDIMITYKGAVPNPRFDGGMPMHQVDVMVDDESADWLQAQRDAMLAPPAPAPQPAPKKVDKAKGKR